MADIDIKDLGNAAALADTDQILAILNGLGQNITWARLKELLCTQLPEATKYSKGLFSGELYNAIYNLQVGCKKEDVDTPLTHSNREYCKLQRTNFINTVTPTANYAFIIRFNIDANHECQYIFDYGGSIYYRTCVNNTWSSPKLIAKAV